MAAPLKDQFGPEIVEQIAATLPVNQQAFTTACLEGFADLGLMDRARRIAYVMRIFLDSDPATAVRQVHDSLGEHRPTGMAAFFYNPHSMFIGTYGLPAFAESMAAMYDLTKVFTAEFCVRPFLVAYPETLVRLRTWATDPDAHVRRLVSEGTRPRLPWAPRLPQFIADPRPVTELLDLLKDDESEYVRRSVGNNLNDISKDNPQTVLQIARAWYPGREALIQRGLRTLLKAGDAQALAILGYGDVDITARADLPDHIRIGQRLPLEIELTGHGRALVDIVVHFVKSGGGTSAKVFKGAQVGVDGSATFRRTISFAQHSTRRQQPGPHRIGVLINGREQDLGTVDVQEITCGG